MRILSKSTIRSFWEIHHDSEEQLLVWYKEMEKSRFKKPKDIIDSFANGRFIGEDRFIFNIKGNQYRLVVKVNFDLQAVWISFIGTHNEYDKINALKI